MMFSHRDSTSDDAYKPDRDQESAEISFSDMIFSSIMIRLGKVSSDSEIRARRNN